MQGFQSLGPHQDHRGTPGKRKGNLEMAEAGHLPWVIAFSLQEPGGGTNTMGIHLPVPVFSGVEGSCGSGMGSQDYTIPSYCILPHGTSPL